MASASVQAEGLLRELDRVWVELGHQNDTAGGGVLRACAMTLIALVEDGPQPVDVAETLAELMHDHPARVIVIRVRGGGQGLTSRVFAQCWMPFGRRQQICAEQIEIDVPAADLGDVPAVLRGLLAPDLPVVLWVRSAALLSDPETSAFLELANKVIVESRSAQDPAWILRQMKELAASGLPVADLAWTRITRWRELVAQLFDYPGMAALRGAIAHVNVGHSGPVPGLAARYLATWTAQCLDGRPEVLLEPAGLQQSWQIQSLELSGPGICVTVRRTERGLVDVDLCGHTRRSVFRQLREADLLREELSVGRRDPIYAAVLSAL